MFSFTRKKKKKTNKYKNKERKYYPLMYILQILYRNIEIGKNYIRKT